MKYGVIRSPAGDEAARVVADVEATADNSARVFGPDEPSVGDIDALIVPVVVDVKAAIVAAIREFAAAGGPVLGIGGGFRFLCETGLLDGAVSPHSEFESRRVHVIVEGRPTPFTQAIPAGRHLAMPLLQADGCYAHDDVAQLEADGRVVFRYCTDDGEVDDDCANPNGSVGNIAGVCNPVGNVVGLAPHPEHTSDGRLLFESAVAWLAGTPSRVGG